jgi:hypothetical protein
MKIKRNEGQTSRRPCQNLSQEFHEYEAGNEINIYRGEQNNGNTKKLRNRICVGYIDRTSVGNTECSSVCLHYVVLVSVE